MCVLTHTMKANATLLTLAGDAFLPRQFEEQGKVKGAACRFISGLTYSRHVLQELHHTQTPSIKTKNATQIRMQRNKM